jgi:hypothetical protein
VKRGEIMKNWIKRAVRTFVQTAIGYVSVNIIAVDWTADISVVKAAIIGISVSAVAAGLAAAINFIEDENKKFE